MVKCKFNGLPAIMVAVRDVELIEAMCNRFLAVCEATGQLKQDFAQSVGVSPQSLTNISNYRNPPSHFAIEAVSRLYGVTADFFYTGNLGGMRDETMATKLRKILARRPSC
jgi:transcriptional regulator with XRE-family HTH domain